MQLVVQDAVAMHDVELTVDAWIEVLPAELLKIDRRLVDRIQEQRLLVEFKRLACENGPWSHG
jgi:hypothetical protein